METQTDTILIAYDHDRDTWIDADTTQEYDIITDLVLDTNKKYWYNACTQEIDELETQTVSIDDPRNHISLSDFSNREDFAAMMESWYAENGWVLPHTENFGEWYDANTKVVGI